MNVSFHWPVILHASQCIQIKECAAFFYIVDFRAVLHDIRKITYQQKRGKADHGCMDVDTRGMEQRKYGSAGRHMGQSLYDFCRRYQKQQLLDEWDPARNLPLTPQTVSYGSHARVWWRCKNRHSWTAAVYARSAGAGCPYCAGRKVMAGYNDLASMYPTLARQWDQEKNLPLVPVDVSAGSQRPVWWRCEKGHSWRAAVRSRVAGCGCPVCARRRLAPGENDLASTYPALAKQWDAEKNGALTPRDVMPGTEKKVWWRCQNGHSWRASVSTRTYAGSGCPYCMGKLVLPGFNDLASQRPELAAQWDAEKNGALTPEQVTPTSNRKAWWRCERGHSFQAVIASRTNGSGCPYCTGKKVLAGFNDLASLEPKISAEWHPTLNGALTPQMVTTGSRKKVWWECAYGHVWKAAIYPRTGRQKCGCPVCAGKVHVAHGAVFLGAETENRDMETVEMQKQNDRPAAGETSPYERCVLCGAETDIRRDTPVSLRSGYIEGGGQLCRSCWQRLYGEK